METNKSLRNVMRIVPAPVTVITFANQGLPRGVTVSSFTSVSLAPPLISFNIMQASRTHDMLNEADHFRVHILSEEQMDLSNRFATPGLSSEEQFKGMSYHLDELGIPVIEDVLATLFCKKFGKMDAGDHLLLLGEVQDIAQSQRTNPLIYFNGSYRRVGAKKLTLTT